MSIYFNSKKGATGKELFALNRQWDELSGFREAGSVDSVKLLDGLGETFGVNSETLNKARKDQKNPHLTINNLRVDEMYRMVDGTATGEDRDWGNQTLLGRLMAGAQTVHIGKKVVESRRYSEAGRVTRSMSGQTDIQMDKTESNYQKAIIPIFDAGYGRDFRDVEAMRSELLPALAEDSQEIEFSLLEDVNDYLWNGDNSLVVDGTSWSGIKGESSVASYSLLTDLTTATAKETTDELLAVIDVLRINNDKSGPFDLFVSPQIMSHMQALATENTSGFATILMAVNTLLPQFASIQVDAKLQGNQVFATVIGSQGLHAKVGMMMSSYQMPRFKHNDPYQFVKWFAAGFQSKNTFSGKKASVYAS